MPKPGQTFAGIIKTGGEGQLCRLWVVPQANALGAATLDGSG